jgi:hypothetical protein
MGFFRTTMECGASALITGTFFLFPLGVAFWPDFSSLPEFIPMGGDGNPVAELAMLDLDDLVKDDVIESNTDGTENKAIEEVEAEKSEEAKGTDTAEVAVESSNKASSTHKGATKPQTATERRAATRASQAEAKRKRAEEAALARIEKAEKAGKGKGKGKDRCLAPDERITKKSKNSYTLESEVVDQYTGSVNSAKSLVRGMGWSYDESGDKDGFQLFGVRCGSPLHQAGLRSKDVIHSINGKQIRSEVQALAAWKLLRNKKKVDVVFSRKGKTRTMKYRVS